MKESLFRRVEAIENKGVGVQITTLCDWVKWVAHGCPGNPVISPGIKDFVHSTVESIQLQKQQEAWSMWERWLA
jgi:hypothetical protein